jgi:hypothetical protein
VGAATTAVVFGQLMTTSYDPTDVACAAALDRVSAPGDLVAVVSADVAHDGSVTNDFQEPTLFYLADRRGFSIAADERTPATVAADAEAGARWLLDDRPNGLPAGFHTGLKPISGLPSGCFIAPLT